MTFQREGDLNQLETWKLLMFTNVERDEEKPAHTRQVSIKNPTV